MIAASLRPVAERYMNSAAEMMQEVGQVTGWTPGSLNGTHFGGIEQDKSMVNLRDLPLIAHVLGW